MSKEHPKAIILLADDEPVVRNFVQHALTYYGYHVLSASDGIEALQLSRSFDGHIHLLLSDIKMPRLKGPELAEIIQRERPHTRILLMTGQSSGSVPEHLKPELLRKPFLPQILIRKIEDSLRSDPNEEFEPL